MWTYFTGDLAAGDVLTRDQLGELWAAVQERWGCTTAATVVAEDLLGDWPVSARVPRRTVSGGALATSPLHTWVRTLAGQHLMDDEDRNSGGWDAIAAEVEADMGLPAGRVDAWVTAVESGVDVAGYWSAMRRMLGEMRHVAVAGASPAAAVWAAWEKLGGGFSWAGAKAEFVAAAEGAVAGLRPSELYLVASHTTEPVWQILSRRNRLALATARPANPLLEGVPVWLWLLGAGPGPSGVGYVPAGVEVALVDSGGDLARATSDPVPLGDVVRLDLGSVDSLEGLEALEVQMEAWDAGTGLDDFEPGAAPDRKGCQVNPGAVFATPHYAFGPA